jgi:hypothetical protein
MDQFSTASVAEAGSLVLCISPDYGCRFLTPVAFRGPPSVACVHQPKLCVDPVPRIENHPLEGWFGGGPLPGSGFLPARSARSRHPFRATFIR